MKKVHSNPQADRNIAAKIIMILFIFTGVTLWTTNLFVIPSADFGLNLRWASFFFNHFLFLFALAFCFIGILKSRKNKDIVLKILLVFAFVFSLIFQIRGLRIFRHDWNYYQSNGFASVQGEVTDVSFPSRSLTEHIYLDGEMKWKGKSYAYVFGGGIDIGDRVTLYYLPTSRFIFYHEFLADSEEKNPF